MVLLSLIPLKLCFIRSIKTILENAFIIFLKSIVLDTEHNKVFLYNISNFESKYFNVILFSSLMQYSSCSRNRMQKRYIVFKGFMNVVDFNEISMFSRVDVRKITLSKFLGVYEFIIHPCLNIKFSFSEQLV